ncbi:tetratricopeptide repeat protein [Actinoplanes rectilineatus]|uniref:tetratricopeptide repeat protein n=1 Tax=Actinoplanes rectilineatus TaxID=113571 RepID=UPI0005F2DF74|nr:tetratricopeptide repeat protein [Actinoplanes rectilineatus]
MTDDLVVLRAESGPIALGPARHLLELLGVDGDAVPARVAATVQHRFGRSGQAAVSLADATGLESQVRYQLVERIDRSFAECADLIGRRLTGPATIRVTGAQRLDAGTRRLLHRLGVMCDHITVSLEPGRPEGRRRALDADERRTLALHAQEHVAAADADWLIERAQLHLHAGDAWTATALLRPLAHDHDRPALHQVLAVGHVMLGHPETAERHYQSWARTGTPLDAARARFGQAMLYARHHAPHLHDDTRAAALLDQALTDLDRAGTDDVTLDRIFNRNGYAVLQVRAGKVDEALAFLDEALEAMTPTTEKNHLHRAALMYHRAHIKRRIGEHAAATREYRKLLDVDPDMPEYHMELALSHMVLGEWAQAVDELDRARDLDPYIPEAHALRAQIAEQQGERDAAIALHRQAWRIAPDDPERVYAYAYALSESQDWTEVIALLDGGPVHADLSCVLAEALVNVGRTDDAVACLTDALELAPDDENLRDNLATVRQAAHA